MGDTLQNPIQKNTRDFFPKKKSKNTNPLQTSQHGSLDHQKNRNSQTPSASASSAWANSGGCDFHTTGGFNNGVEIYHNYPPWN